MPHFLGDLRRGPKLENYPKGCAGRLEIKTGPRLGTASRARTESFPKACKKAHARKGLPGGSWVVISRVISRVTHNYHPC